MSGSEVSAPGPMLEALLARMPEQLAEDVRGVRNLFIITGCSAKDASVKVAELYSPPRVTRELDRFSEPGSGVDVRPD